MNPLPFFTTDQAFGAAFAIGLSDLLNSILQAVAPPALACVTLWIIVQGILIMRGDLDMRRGITRILRIAIVVSLVTTAANYNYYVQQVFTTTIPAFINGLTNPVTAVIGIPASLDAIFDLCQIEFQGIAAEIGPMNPDDVTAFQSAQFVLYGALWTVFAIYEVTVVITDLLLAIGPLILLGYLFDATRGITDRWIGQLISYALLSLLITTVATIVISTETIYLTANLALIALTGPTSAQIVSFYEMDMFLLTGDAFILALPAIAAALAGGVAMNPGEALGMLAQHGPFRQARLGSAQGYGKQAAAVTRRLPG